MEKLIRDRYPKLTKNSQNPIVWRKVKNIQEHVELLLAKLDEEKAEYEEALQEFRKYRDVRNDMPQEHEVAYWQVTNEIGDALEVYDVLIHIYRNIIGDLFKTVEFEDKRQSFLVWTIQETGLLHIDADSEKVQKIKKETRGSFLEGVVGIFPDATKAEK
jgi:hypothetical protein